MTKVIGIVGWKDVGKTLEICWGHVGNMLEKTLGKCWKNILMSGEPRF